MIYLRAETDELLPAYMTEHSAGADLKARESLVIPVGQVGKVPTGVWISRFDREGCSESQIVELQVRARSSLAYKHGVALANGVGTIDADYPDEICVLLHNHGQKDFVIEKGDRIAQLVLATVQRIPDLSAGGKRVGGFGSTGAN